jgi:Sporulation and spore germination
VTPRLVAVIGGVAVVAAVAGGVLFDGSSHWYGRSAAKPSAAGAPTEPSTAGRRIKARLFYVEPDGIRLSSVERDVSFGEGTVEQARQLIEAQIGAAAEPLVSAVPPGTKLRNLFVTERGEAFVDFSRELLTGHSGGSTDEMLTVYTIVDVLTANLPAVTAVQLLVDGKQVDTLAGHVDLRRPLAKNLAWVQ